MHMGMDCSCQYQVLTDLFPRLMTTMVCLRFQLPRNDRPEPWINDQTIVGSSNIAIFSDKKIASISTRLGHERFHSLFNRLNDSMSARARRDIRSTNSATNTKDNPAALQSEMTTDSVREYIRSASPFNT